MGHPSVHIYPFMFTCNKDLKQNQECVISQKSLVSVYQKYNSTFSILIAIQFSEDWLNPYDNEKTELSDHSKDEEALYQ